MIEPRPNRIEYRRRAGGSGACLGPRCGGVAWYIARKEAMPSHTRKHGGDGEPLVENLGDAMQARHGSREGFWQPPATARRQDGGCEPRDALRRRAWTWGGGLCYVAVALMVSQLSLTAALSARPGARLPLSGVRASRSLSSPPGWSRHAAIPGVNAHPAMPLGRHASAPPGSRLQGVQGAAAGMGLSPSGIRGAGEGGGGASKLRGQASVDLVVSPASQEGGKQTLADTGRRTRSTDRVEKASAGALPDDAGKEDMVAMDEGGVFNLIPSMPLSNIGAPHPASRGTRRAGRGRLLPYSSASYRSMIAFKEVVDEAAGWTTPELSGTRMLTRNKTKRIGEVLFLVDMPKEVGDQDDEDEDEGGLALDASLTLVNALMFVSVLGGWKGVWDLQDVLNVPPLVSIWTGVILFVARLKLESFLEMPNDWSEWLKEVGSLGKFPFSVGKLEIGSVKRHLQMATSGFLSFSSTVCVWRGVWTALDNTHISWSACTCIAVVCYALLSVLQGHLSRKGNQLAASSITGDQEPSTTKPILPTNEFSRPEFTLSPEPREFS